MIAGMAHSILKKRSGNADGVAFGYQLEDSRDRPHGRGSQSSFKSAADVADYAPDPPRMD